MNNLEYRLDDEDKNSCLVKCNYTYEDNDLVIESLEVISPITNKDVLPDMGKFAQDHIEQITVNKAYKRELEKEK